MVLAPGDDDDDDIVDSVPVQPLHPMEIGEEGGTASRSALSRAGHQIHKVAHRTRTRLEHLPRPARMGIGVLFIVGGIAGVLPVLGFWMVPVGLAILAMDVPLLERAWDRFKDWHHQRHAPQIERDASD